MTYICNISTNREYWINSEKTRTNNKSSEPNKTKPVKIFTYKDNKVKIVSLDNFNPKEGLTKISFSPYIRAAIEVGSAKFDQIGYPTTRQESHFYFLLSGYSSKSFWNIIHPLFSNILYKKTGHRMNSEQIKSYLKNLSAKESIMLAAEITQNVFEFDIDKSDIAEIKLFMLEIDLGEFINNGKGVCRHYVILFEKTFDEMKLINPKLTNIYASSPRFKVAGKDFGHTFNRLAEVVSPNEVIITHIDNTDDDSTDGVFGNTLYQDKYTKDMLPLMFNELYYFIASYYLMKSDKMVNSLELALKIPELTLMEKDDYIHYCVNYDDLSRKIMIKGLGAQEKKLADKYYSLLVDSYIKKYNTINFLALPRDDFEMRNPTRSLAYGLVLTGNFSDISKLYNNVDHAEARKSILTGLKFIKFGPQFKNFSNESKIKLLKEIKVIHDIVSKTEQDELKDLYNALIRKDTSLKDTIPEFED